MTAYHPTEEAGTERFIYLELEPRPSWGGDCRHIRAGVVRLAQAHIKRENGSLDYHDGATVTGWRWATWSSNKKNGIYVDGLKVRGQLDVGIKQLNDGKPYANELEFTESQLRKRQVYLMHTAFKALDIKRAKLIAAGHVFRDDMESEVRALALSLGIKRFVVRRKNWPGTSLEDVGAHRMLGLDRLGEYIDQLVDLAHGRNQN